MQSTWVILKIQKAAARGSNARVVVCILLHCQQDSCINPICWNTVTTMSNSGPYLVTPVASQLYSSTPVAHHLLRSRSRRYTSVKYDPWSSPYSVLTTPHRLPCLDVSSPCTCYIHHLVSFSLDLVYFTQTLLEINRTVVVCLPTYISMHRTRVEFLVP